MLTTTSTGTRSARALLEARIVRRIPFPAFVEIKNNTLRYISQSTYTQYTDTQKTEKKYRIFNKTKGLLTAIKRPLGPLKLSIHP